jgi:hypothetical protein
MTVDGRPSENLKIPRRNPVAQRWRGAASRPGTISGGPRPTSVSGDVSKADIIRAVRRRSGGQRSRAEIAEVLVKIHDAAREPYGATSGESRRSVRPAM